MERDVEEAFFAGDADVRVIEVHMVQALSRDLMLLSFPTRDRPIVVDQDEEQEGERINVVKVERRDRPYEHVYRRAGYLEPVRPPTDYLGACACVRRALW